jgi:hypothetical protein
VTLIRALLEQSSTRTFNVAHLTFPLRKLHDRIRTKDEPLLLLGMRDRVGQSFDFEN